MTKPIHGEPVPLHIQRGLSATPPVECSFQIGDIVDYTNPQGLKSLRCVVIGFSEAVQSWGGFVHLDKDAWWFPVPAASLRLSE